MNLFIRTAGRVFLRKERLSDHDTIQREHKNAADSFAFVDG